jgi:hypothetical protein
VNPSEETFPSLEKHNLIFLKYFDIKQQRLQVHSSIYLSLDSNPTKLKEKIVKLMGWDDGTILDSLKVYEELKIGWIEHVSPEDFINYDGNIFCFAKVDDWPRPRFSEYRTFSDLSILLPPFIPHTKDPILPSLVNHYDALLRKLWVNVKFRSSGFEREDFCLTLRENIRCEEVRVLTIQLI